MPRTSRKRKKAGRLKENAKQGLVRTKTSGWLRPMRFIQDIDQPFTRSTRTRRLERLSDPLPAFAVGPVRSLCRTLVRLDARRRQCWLWLGLLFWLLLL